MKKDIEWHEECLKNSIASEKQNREWVEADLVNVNKLLKHNIFYASQIQKAKKQKKKGFDRDRFLKVYKHKEES